MIVRFAAVAGLLPLLCFGCDRSTEPTGDGRIVFFQGIDGVRLGYDTTTVFQLLGLPDSTKDHDTLGISLYYVTGPHATLHVTYHPTPSMYGQGVTSILVKAPYSGQTSKGIGIQSPRKDVHDTHGTPDQTTDLFDWYIQDDSIMTVLSYQDDRVRLITVAIIQED